MPGRGLPRGAPKAGAGSRMDYQDRILAAVKGYCVWSTAYVSCIAYCERTSYLLLRTGLRTEYRVPGFVSGGGRRKSEPPPVRPSVPPCAVRSQVRSKPYAIHAQYAVLEAYAVRGTKSGTQYTVRSTCAVRSARSVRSTRYAVLRTQYLEPRPEKFGC